MEETLVVLLLMNVSLFPVLGVIMNVGPCKTDIISHSANVGQLITDTAIVYTVRRILIYT